jgi:aryl-alcohol dehydrogenase-like predicted oxidoreductase
MSKMEDVDIVLGPGGALETFLKARKEGKVRYIGFSAHNEDVALRLLGEFQFDSVLFPINYVCFAQGNFGPRLLKKAKEKNAACLALKSLAYTRWADKEKRRANHPKCWYQPISDLEKASLAKQVWPCVLPFQRMSQPRFRREMRKYIVLQKH